MVWSQTSFYFRCYIPYCLFSCMKGTCYKVCHRKCRLSVTDCDVAVAVQKKSGQYSISLHPTIDDASIDFLSDKYNENIEDWSLDQNKANSCLHDDEHIFIVPTSFEGDPNSFYRPLVYQYYPGLITIISISDPPLFHVPYSDGDQKP